MSLTRFQVESVLPLELFATIIDCLEEYPEALKSCSLVSHSWLLFARPHVFRKLQLDPYYHGWGPSGCKLLWGLVGGSSPYCPYIQTLGIEDSEDLGMKIEAIMVAGLIKNLPRLRSLYLDRLVSSTMTLVTRPLLSIHHLSLELPTLSPKSLIDTLMIFSEIYHLHVSIDDSPTQGYEHEHSTVMDSLQIRTLSLEACRYGIAIIRKVLQPILVHITSLNIPHYAITDVEFIGELIHDLSSQLDSVTLAVIYRPANKDLDDLGKWRGSYYVLCFVIMLISHYERSPYY